MDAYDVQDAIDRWTIRYPPGGARRTARPPIAHAQGPIIHDTAGARYLDFGSNPTGAILGHNHPRYIEAVRRRLHTVGDDTFLDQDALLLHCRLGEILTPPLQKSLLVPHGDAALRVAAGMARAVTGGADIIAVSATHDGAVCFTRPATAASHPSNLPVTGVSEAHGTAGVCPDPAQCACGAQGGLQPCPWAAFEATVAACERRPAALLMKSFAGGAFGAGAGWAPVLRRLCHQYGMLLIVDETATGYGRTGRMWGHQHDDVVPDILIASARFGAGQSIDVVCTAPDIAGQVRACDNGVLDLAWHDPVACIAAVTTIDIVREEELVSRAAAIGEYLKTRLGTMAADKPMIAAVHGRGAMYAIELSAGWAAGNHVHQLGQEVVQACRDKGLLLREPAGDDSDRIVRVAPPMVSTETQLDEGLDILDRVLRDIAAAPRASGASRPGAREPGQHQLS